MFGSAACSGIQVTSAAMLATMIRSFMGVSGIQGRR